GGMAGARVLVVGASGVLGRACVKALSAAGRTVDAVDVVDSSVEGASSFTVANVIKDGIPEALLDGAGTIFHFAWSNDPGRGNADMTNDVCINVASAVRAFEQAARAGLKRIIYPSSGGTIYRKNPPLPTPDTAPA